MYQSIPTTTTNSSTDLLTGLGVWALIAIGITLIIFLLWLYFGAGTLSRLTDIKYKLNDIEQAIKNSNNSNNDSNEDDEDNKDIDSDRVVDKDDARENNT
jgi:hypothetical protein